MCSGWLGGWLTLCAFASLRSLYWVNRGKKGRRTLEAAGMDGSDRKVLAAVHMEEPVGLTLDPVAGRLYWISEYKEVLERGQEGKRLSGGLLGPWVTADTSLNLASTPHVVFWPRGPRRASWAGPGS